MTDYQFPEKKKQPLSRYARILASAAYLPQERVTNRDILEQGNLPFKEAIIEKSTGVRERRVAPAGQADSDLLAAAAIQCLEKAGLCAGQLSRLIVTKFIGDNLFPMTASRVQRLLGSNTAFHAFDLEGGTSSFLQALDLADKYIGSGDQYILLASGGIINKFVSATDPRTAFLFGDGAAALLLGPAEQPHFIDSYFYSNYDYYDFCKGHSITGLSVDIVNRKRTELFFDGYHMGNWKEVLPFYEAATDRLLEALLGENHLAVRDIDYFLIAGPNKPCIEKITSRISCTADRTLSLLETRGNTLSAMLPMLYHHLDEQALLSPGRTILFLSYGEGVSGGGILYRINSGEVINP